MRASKGGDMIKLRTPGGIVWCVEELTEFIEGMCGRYADLIPREQVVSVIWSPVWQASDVFFSVDRITRNGVTVAAISVNPRYWDLTFEERREEFAMTLQLHRWQAEGRLEVSEEGLTLHLEEGELSGEAAAEYLNRHARSLRAR